MFPKTPLKTTLQMPGELGILMTEKLGIKGCMQNGGKGI